MFFILISQKNQDVTKMTVFQYIINKFWKKLEFTVNQFIGIKIMHLVYLRYTAILTACLRYTWHTYCILLFLQYGFGIATWYTYGILLYLQYAYGIHGILTIYCYTYSILTVYVVYSRCTWYTYGLSNWRVWYHRRLFWRSCHHQKSLRWISGILTYSDQFSSFFSANCREKRNTVIYFLLSNENSLSFIDRSH